MYNQLQGAAQGGGNGGAFGDAANYYRNNLSDNPADFNAFAAPALRQYNEDIVPGLSEQFAGMGAGGLSSSGFQNAQIQGATDLSERLGALRANLRQAGAQGLQNIGQLGLGQYSQNMVTQPGTQGVLSQAVPAALATAGTALAGPALGVAGYHAGQAVNNWFGGKGQQVGMNTGPYGQSGPQASPQMPRGQGGFQQPGFMQQGRGF
ncbi:MAG: hypothetical protein WC089_03800 [Candidatus Paceibacterota bacterium]